MATHQHHNFADLSTAPHASAGDWRRCADCGRAYNAHHGACPTCPTLYWAVWDAAILDDPSGDLTDAEREERGIYESGFVTRAAPQAAIPRIIAQMAALGEDLALWQFVVVPAD